MISTPLKVKGIGFSKHKSEEFATLFSYFHGIDGTGKLVYASMRCEIHLVEGLQANLLFGYDIISQENFIIDIKKKSTLIGSCRVTILISDRQREQLLMRKLLMSEVSVVLPQSKAMIPLVLVSVPYNRDFLFYPTAQPNLTLFILIIDPYTSKILIRNASDQPLRILL